MLLRDDTRQLLAGQHCIGRLVDSTVCIAVKHTVPGIVLWYSSKMETQPMYPRAAAMCRAVDPWDSQGVTLVPVI